MKKIVFPIFAIILMVNVIGCSNQSTTNRSNENNETKTVEPIDEEVFVESLGTKLYLKLKGQDKTKPVILFLHGGPGDVFLGLLSFEVYAGKNLEKDYVMAYLHQRGMVNSPMVADSTQTIENHVEDVTNVVNYLTQKFNTKKIILMGHSWGGLLGFNYLLKDDSKIEKFISVASPINMEKNNRRSYEETLKWAKGENNANALNDLTEKALPPFNFDKLLVKNMWAGQAGGKIDKNFSFERITTETEFKEFKREWQITQMNVIRTMFNELTNTNLEGRLNEIKIPVLFIAGKNDTYVTADCVEDGFNIYRSEKEYKLFENSHHLIFVDEPELFVKTVEEFID